jgi:hypothetical protein
MANLPGRVHTLDDEFMGEREYVPINPPKGMVHNARLDQMKAYYEANRAKILAQRRAKKEGKK